MPTTATSRRRTTDFVELQCASCGEMFDISKRREYERRKGTLPACDRCRHPAVIEITPELRQWWLDRFTVQEIVELAEPLRGL